MCRRVGFTLHYTTLVLTVTGPFTPCKWSTGPYLEAELDVERPSDDKAVGHASPLPLATALRVR